MKPWTADELLGSHLAHRLSILHAYRERAKLEHNVEEAVYRNAYNALLDAAMVTCRSLWELIGVTVPSQPEKNPANPTVGPQFKSWARYIAPSLPVGIEVLPFDKVQFDALPERKSVIMVLVAANKCVAHLDQYPNHGVGSAEMESAIEATLREVPKRIQRKA
jgi:hypothetical protein